jgi:hypothetical protein
MVGAPPQKGQVRSLSFIDHHPHNHGAPYLTVCRIFALSIARLRTGPRPYQLAP